MILIALLLDAILGEPRRFHPLVGFGNLAGRIEGMFYGNNKLSGCVAVFLVVLPFVVFAIEITALPWHFIFDILVLYLAVGWHSLSAHAQQVRHALVANDLQLARQKVAMMVSRDTAHLDHSGVTKSTIESVLENGNDAIFGAIFWFVIAGAPGAIAYRLINTLDAMWGYRNQRYHQFGWAAARLDDCLNYVPARLTAFSYALAGQVNQAFQCWQKQSKTWKSPNAGPVMAAGAGSLNIKLGGSASYQGKIAHRPTLGMGSQPTTQDIDCALRLIKRTVIIWLIILSLGESLVQHSISI